MKDQKRRPSPRILRQGRKSALLTGAFDDAGYFCGLRALLRPKPRQGKSNPRRAWRRAGSRLGGLRHSIRACSKSGCFENDSPAGAPPQAPFSLTPRFSGVAGGRESNSTVLTVSRRTWRKRRGKSARLCRRFPTCRIADFQSAALGYFGRYRIDASPADWKSATPACLAAGRQQTGSLRYTLAHVHKRPSH